MNELSRFLLTVAGITGVIVVVGFWMTRSMRWAKRSGSMFSSAAWALLFFTSGRMPPPPPASQIEEEDATKKNREIGSDKSDSK